MTALRLVFLGSDIIALPLLEWLSGEGREMAEIIGVFTQPDRPTGRGQQVVANGIKTWALALQLPVLQPEKLTEDVRLQLAALQPDIALVMAYGHILREAFIATPRLGTLNLHASLLPHYRGASPIQTAIACGEKETGVSLMRIVRKLDAGPVAEMERAPVGRRDTAVQIEQKLAEACVPLLRRTLPRFSSGDLRFAEQDETQATYCRRLIKTDGVLDFRVQARELASRINGLFPWPSCGVMIAGQLIKIGLADVAADESTADAPGTVLGADPEALRIAAGQGVLRLLKMQRPGGKMLEARDFLRGFPVPSGLILPSETMPPLVASAPFKF